MINRKAYWLWLQHAFGAGSAKPFKLLEGLNDIEDLYSKGSEYWSSFKFVTDKEKFSLNNFTLEDAQAQLEYCEKLGHKIVVYSDERYPEKLKEINSPALALYYKGEFPQFDEKLVIAVVGSRNIDENTIKMTEHLCYELARGGALIVSGGALGIDSAAHKGSMRGMGKTTAFLPCSLDINYLMSNQILRNQIITKHGCLMSEYAVNTNVNKGSFDVRNRLISGVCDALLVVKAKKKSGTMLTAAHATKQNKDIFAVPGDVDDEYSEGTNLLIQDGATAVTRADDILEQYAHRFKQENVFNAEKIVSRYCEMKKTGKRSTDILSVKAKMVYETLCDTPIHISEICSMTGLKVSQVLSSVTELEILDYIEIYYGQRYSIK